MGPSQLGENFLAFLSEEHYYTELFMIYIYSLEFMQRMMLRNLTCWGVRAGLDLESGLKNGLGCKKSTPLIGREVGTCLFKFTP